MTREIGSWALIFVVSGILEMFVAGENFSVNKNSCLLIPPGVRHGGRGTYPPQLSFFWIHFLPTTGETARILENLSTQYPVRNPGRLSDYFQQFLALQESEPEDRDGLNLAFSLIMHEACKPVGNFSEMPKTVPRLLYEALNLMTLRFREPISTSSIARDLNCNPDYLGRLFRRHCGKCIVDTLNEIRLRHAAKMLEHSNLNIGQIAYETGFCDPVYFRRRFIRQYAMTPRMFRQQKLKGHVNTE